jgi:hypothetical protein
VVELLLFNYLRLVHDDTSGRAAYLADFEVRLAEGLHIVGSPDTIKKQVQEHRQITVVHYFNLWFIVCC